MTDKLAGQEFDRYAFELAYKITSVFLRVKLEEVHDDTTSLWPLNELDLQDQYV